MPNKDGQMAEYELSQNSVGNSVGHLQLEQQQQQQQEQLGVLDFISSPFVTGTVVYLIAQVAVSAYGRSKLAEQCGFNVGWVQLRYRTTALNRWFLRLGLGAFDCIALESSLGQLSFYLSVPSPPSLSLPFGFSSIVHASWQPYHRSR